MTTNHINNKKYIGKRTCHCNIDSDTYLGSGKLLKLAIKKYGQQNFSKQILEICDSYQECNAKEKYWIRFYNAISDKNFYNIASGGDGGNTYENLPIEERDRIRMLKSQQTSGCNNPRYGTKWSDETRNKIISAQKEYYLRTGLSSTSGKFGKDNKLSKKIICVEMQKTYYGIREASRETGISFPNIIRALKSEGKFSAGKYNGQRLHWKYIKE